MGLLSAFKNLDLKDKIGDVWEFVDDPVEKVLGETVETLNRPSGAARGALASLFDDESNNSFENIIAGWKDPNKFRPDTGNRVLDIGVEAATDPLTYIPVVGQAGLAKAGLRAPRLLFPLLSTVASPQSSLTKKVAGEVAVNAAARGGSELGTNLTKGTPLESVGGIAGGLVAGAATARKFSGPKMLTTKAGILEEQLDDVPSFGYQIKSPEGSLVIAKNFGSVQEAEDFLNNTGLSINPDYKVVSLSPQNMSDQDWTDYLSRKPDEKVYDDIEEVITGTPSSLRKFQVVVAGSPHNFDSFEEAQNFLNTLKSQNLELFKNYSDSDIVEQFIPNPAAYKEELAHNLEIALQNGQREFIRKKNIIFLDSAYTDEGLVKSHEDFSVPFDAHQFDNPKVYRIASSWIGKGVGGGDVLHDAFKNASPDASVFYADGENWRTWAATQETPLIKGSERLVFMYRGEKGKQVFNPVKGHPVRFNNYQFEVQAPHGAWSSYVIFEDGKAKIIWPGEYKLEVPSEEYFEVIQKGKKVPIYPESQIVSSHTVDPKSPTIDWFLDTVNDQKVITGEWVPFDNIISPVGKVSMQREFLVLDPDLISDEAYLKILGVHKNAPRTELFMVRNRQNSEIVGYYKTIEEAQKAASSASNLQVIPVVRGGAQISESSSGLKIPKSLANELPTHTLIPGRLTNVGQGDNLIDEITESTPPNGLTPEQRLALQESGEFPSVGGGTLTPPEFEKLITSYGYDPKVAKHLDAIAPKDREALAQTLIDNMGAQGADAEFLRTVIQDYRKAGIQDPTKMARLNNMLRGMWATGDGSWIGIQGLLTIPRLLSRGDIKDALDLLTVPLLTFVGNKKALSKWMHHTIDSTPADFPKLSEIGAEGRLHLAFLKGNPDFDFKVWDKIIPLVKPDEAFMAAGDVARVSMFYNEWRRYGAGLTGEARTKAIEDIARAINRATGIAEHPFGGQIGSFALFAPRFFQSQLEVVMKSFTDWDSVEGALARRQLSTLVGAGAMLTLAANYVRGEETEINPLDPNFMRIRNINGNDISVFGPWDSLVKLFVHLGQGDLTYARTKAGPLVSLAMNLVTKSDFIGNPVEANPYAIAQAVGTGVAEQVQAGDINPLNLPGRIDEASRNTLKSLFVPFAWQDVGNQNFTGGVANFFGVKNSPLSRSEIIDANMQNLGLDPNDPLARRQYFADHPEDRSKFSADQQRINSVKDDIQFRREANDAKLTNGEQSLTDWRESRKILTRESMNKMAILMEGVEFKSDTPQKRWIDSYFKLFQGSQDPITRDIDGQKFDKLQSAWLQANGQQAYEYVQRFLQVGKSDTELQYLQDMQQLDNLGYFSLPRYSNIVYEYSGGLSDDQIQNYRDRVSAARSVNPELAKMTFKKALQRVYGDTLTYEQIQALDLAGSDKYGNPAIDEIKATYPHLVTWFNPKATWDTYQTAKGTATEVPQVYRIPALTP